MSDLTPTEQTRLATRLGDGVPEAPHLPDLATTAASRARGLRRTRRLGAVVGAAVAVAAVIAVPRLVGSDRAQPPTVRPPAHCVARSNVDHQDFRHGTAAWLRFCPAVHSEDPVGAVTPRTVLTDGAAALVATWQAQTRHLEVAPWCGPGAPPTYDLQVGFTDGTVSQIQLVCLALVEPSSQYVPQGLTEMYDTMMTAIGEQGDAEFRDYSPPGPQRQCPRTLDDPARMNIDGTSADQLASTGPLLDLTATEGLVCGYEHGRLTDTRRNRDPERLLIDSGVHWLRADRNIRRNLSHEPVYQQRLGSYLVSLRDKTNTWRTFTITGRYGRVRLFRGDGTVTTLGYADTELFRAVGAHPYGRARRS
jgi:hypothetical protein